jgi:hypothetical protein
MAADVLAPLLAAVAAGRREPLYLVAGDLVLAEPAAERLAAALAAAAGCEVERHRRPARLTPLLEDLRTYSLFTPAKVVVAVGSAVLADRADAADLFDEALEAGAPPAGDELGPRARPAASRLLQALRLFGIDPYAGEPPAALAQVPAWALGGGQAARRRRGKGRGKAEVEEAREELANLLAAARAAEMQGWAETDLAELGSIAQLGLPPGHALVLAESAAATDHPLVAALAARGAYVDAGRLSAERGGGWKGLDLIAGELERQTGAAIAPDALAELARRTLRQEERHADSTSRFAAEYRKLADLAAGGSIERALVEEAIVDRGEEDVWQLLDAVAAGRGGEALDRLARLMRGADDPFAARLAFFGLLAAFCRQLTAVGGLLQAGEVPKGESSYQRFKARIAPLLQAELAGGAKNPVAHLHPFRLHRVYLAASRLPPGDLGLLPWRVLETETRLKGESGDADTALAELLSAVAGAARGGAAARAAR